MHNQVWITGMYIYTYICFQAFEDIPQVKNIQIINCGHESDPIQVKDIDVSHNNDKFDVFLKLQATAKIGKPIKVM